jgi:predicted transcriptional regulator
MQHIDAKSFASLRRFDVTEGVEKLFFELASNSRMSILRELNSKDLKMQEVSRQLDITPTEAFRQLNRLSEAGLIQRRPEGSYDLTQYGKVVLYISTVHEFAFHHRQYILTHDLERLPAHFVSRMGALSNVELVLNPMDSIDRSQKVLREVGEFAWGIAEGNPPEMTRELMEDNLRRGIRFKLIIPSHLLPPSPSHLPPNIELRGISEVPMVTILTERTAVACFRSTDGRMDYAGFFGDDPMFREWVKDLFLFYWDQGKIA